MKRTRAETNPKRHHWVPECYLRAWWDPASPVGEKPHVWVIERQTREGKPLSIDSVFVKTHLYTLTTPDGEKDFELERTLSRVEDDFSRIMERKIVPRKPLPWSDRLGLAFFAAATIARTPRQRDHARGQWQQVLDMCDDMERAMKAATPEQRQRMSPVATGSGPSLTMNQVRELAAQPLQHSLIPFIVGAGKILARMKIAVFVAEGMPGFITSDAPCVLYDPAAYKRPPIYRPPGLAYKTVEVSLPLAPNRMLHFSWEPRFDGMYLPIDGRVVDEVNRTTQFHADKQILSCKNETCDFWFEDRPLPAWENTDKAKELLHAPDDAA
jgi:Protein of unknown function (DUF4238)